jgi:carboxymethylenebutenolidase
MCLEHDSAPPIPPIAGGALDARDITLTSADGTRFMAFAARATEPTGAGMIVIPDVRGLHVFYKELATRFAEHGIDAVAIDFFARTATTDDRGDSFDFMPEVGKTTPETLQLDIDAAAAYLRSADGGAVKGLYAMGFCFGGALASLQAATDLGYRGVVPFYGWPLGLTRWPDRPRPIDQVANFKCPVLAIYGAADPGIPPEAVQAYDDALTSAGIEHESINYPDAPHSFFDRRQPEYLDISLDAWERMKAFVQKHNV